MTFLASRIILRAKLLPVDHPLSIGKCTETCVTFPWLPPTPLTPLAFKAHDGRQLRLSPETETSLARGVTNRNGSDGHSSLLFRPCVTRMDANLEARFEANKKTRNNMRTYA